MDVSEETAGEASAMPSLLDTMTGSAEARALLGETQMWLRVFGIVAYVSLGLVAIFVMIFALAAGLGEEADKSDLPDSITAVSTLVTLMAYAYLLRQGNRTRSFLRTGGNEEFVAALVAQRMFWRLVAISLFVTALVVLMQVASRIESFVSARPDLP